MTIRAVLFDLDNTLHDRDAAFRRWAERFTQERLGCAPGTTGFTDAVSWLVSQDGGGYGSKPQLFQRLVQRYPEAFSLREEEDVEELVAAFHAALVTETRLEPDTQALLRQLKDSGIPFGIVTNGSARQQHKIEYLGLHHLNECILISETFGAKKPSAAIFLAGAAQLGIAPEECLFVGDHPENDIVGARQVGMKTA